MLRSSGQVKLRLDGDKPYVTDNSNYIIDLYFKVGEPLEFVLCHHQYNVEAENGI